MLLFVPDCITHFHRQFLGRTGSPSRSIDYLGPWTNEAVDLYFLALWSIGSDASMYQ